MRVILIETALPLATLAVALWSAIFGGNPLAVILAATVFVVVMVLTYRTPDRQFYLLAAGQPLVVTIGITDLFAGILVQFLLIVLFFAEDLSPRRAKGRVSFLVVPAGTVAFSLVCMGMSHVLIPFLALLALTAAGAVGIGMQNRLLKRKYSREGA